MSIEISVIIPVYNVESYLEECLDSVINQSFRDIEIIAIDDGSTDNTLNILRDYSSRDTRIKTIKQENKGASGARNAGISAAKGEYLCFVDGDDYLCKNALQTIYDKICDGKIEVLCFNTYIIYETPEVEKTHNMTDYFMRSTDYSEITTGKEMFAAMMANNEFCSPVWLMVIKRSWVQKNNIRFEEGITYEDEKYSLQCYMHADTILHIKDKLYTYRIRTGSVSIENYTCHALYSAMVCFQYALKVIEAEEARNDLHIQLIRYAQYLARKISFLDSRIPLKEKLQYDVKEPFIDMMFRSMKLGKYGNKVLNEGIYIEGFLQQMKKADRIIIYGAGEVGRLLYQYLIIHKLQDKIIAFTVTKLTNSENKTLPLPIYEIDDLAIQYADDKETLLIIAGGRKILGEMLEKSEAAEFSNVVLLDETIKAHIRTELKGYEWL